MGYTVVIAEDGADAQTVFDNTPMILMWSAGSGVAARRRHRGVPSHQAAKVTTPIILTSGHASDPAVSELLGLEWLPSCKNHTV